MHLSVLSYWKSLQNSLNNNLFSRDHRCNWLCFTCDRLYDSIMHILSSRDVRPIFSSYFVAILRIQTVWTARNPNIWLHYGIGCARWFVSHASSLLVTRAIHFWSKICEWHSRVQWIESYKYSAGCSEQNITRARKHYRVFKYLDDRMKSINTFSWCTNALIKFDQKCEITFSKLHLVEDKLLQKFLGKLKGVLIHATSKFYKIFHVWSIKQSKQNREKKSRKKFTNSGLHER